MKAEIISCDTKLQLGYKVDTNTSFLSNALSVARLLRKRNKTIAVAESCTGGLISDLLTDIPGSSAYFIAGIVAYSNKMKADALNVDNALIKKHGAVSRQVARAMAENLRKITSADIGLSVTGIAGPSGGSKKKPVGLVYIGLAAKKDIVVKKFVFPGTRRFIKIRTAKTALNLVRQALR